MGMNKRIGGLLDWDAHVLLGLIDSFVAYLLIGYSVDSQIGSASACPGSTTELFLCVRASEAILRPSRLSTLLCCVGQGQCEWIGVLMYVLAIYTHISCRFAF